MWRVVVLAITGTLAIIPVLKSYLTCTFCATQQTLNEEVVIVTGANTGIGKQTALLLANKGAHVVLACRNVKAGEQVAREIKRKTGHRYVRCEKLDLTSFASIVDFVDRIRRREKRLYGLVNNAGVFHLPFQLTGDGFDETLQTNYLGPFLLTYLLLDLLKESAPARIININSEAHNIPQSLDIAKITHNYADQEPYNRFLAYGTTKLCLMLFTTKLAKLLEDTGVTVNSVNPGNVRTDIYRHFPLIRDLPFWSVSNFLVWLTFNTPRQGAQTSVHLLADPTLYNVSGEYFRSCNKRAEPSSLSKSVELEEDLWAATLQWLHPFLANHGRI
uniref:Uncharacterized protein n=1 Tax=Graphocephala atropunctata TaxID=36148 RepID=A0A1B6MGV9_9HEMI